MGGAKKRPIYKIVVADSRFPRDGRFIEKLGFFNPLLPKDKKDRIGLELDKIKYWLSKGAKPTMRVARILGQAELIPMPAKGNNPKKSVPKKNRKKEISEFKKSSTSEEAKQETEAKKEAPKAEAKKEAPKAEAKKEAPKAEAKKEAPKAEAKKEAPKVEESKK